MAWLHLDVALVDDALRADMSIRLAWAQDATSPLDFGGRMCLTPMWFSKIMLSRNTLVACTNERTLGTSVCRRWHVDRDSGTVKELPTLWLAFLKCIRDGNGMFWFDPDSNTILLPPVAEFQQVFIPQCCNLENHLSVALRERPSVVDKRHQATLCLKHVYAHGPVLFAMAYRVDASGYNPVSTPGDDTFWVVMRSPLEDDLDIDTLLEADERYNRGAAPFLCQRVQCCMDRRLWVKLHSQMYYVLWNVKYK